MACIQYLFVQILLVLLLSACANQFYNQNELEDQPHSILTWKVLEGVTEPFDSFQADDSPPWKLMKMAADQKAAMMRIQQALHEYGQLIRHPHLFREMPLEDRYDVFLSMAKLLKVMGFHQRAESLLYEAMSYSNEPYEAHLQLALLSLDKEDLEKAKIHLKNCLFFRETDIIILIHLAVILIAEGKTHEAKFFISRVLTGLESRVNRISSIIQNKINVDMSKLASNIDHLTLSSWVEDLMAKVLYGDFRITTAGAVEMFNMFSNLYQWLSVGEMTGRFVFDLGQALYERGKPQTGKMMMQRGFETADVRAEGAVSMEIIKIRMAFDYPFVPTSISQIIESYINMTSFLADPSSLFVATKALDGSTNQVAPLIDVENIMDVYWPIPLLAWSGLPVTPVLKELSWKFDDTRGFERTDILSQHWLVMEPVEIPVVEVEPTVSSSEEFDDDPNTSATATAAAAAPKDKFSLSSIASTLFASTSSSGVGRAPPSVDQHQQHKATHRRSSSEGRLLHGRAGDSRTIKIEVGIFGGHMNNHAVGQMILRRILSLVPPNRPHNERIRFTLLALALVPDEITKIISSLVARVVNLPMSTAAAWKIIETLHVDIMLFPDWAPFPDQQSVLFQSFRMAPLQICIFVRGSSCYGSEIDYYLLPMELEAAYLSTPAIDVGAQLSTGRNDSDISNSQKHSTKNVVRPQWLELFQEQVVLIDWPIITLQSVNEVSQSILFQASSKQQIQLEQQQQQQHQHQPIDFSGTSSSHSSAPNSASGIMAPAEMEFSPADIEGQVFFADQPVAVIPLEPTYVHPLMDDAIFRIMRSNPSLHMVLILPESFLMHVSDVRQKMAWARRVVRRLWARGGNLAHRIRLLPTPLSDHRLMQFLRKADMVLDSFPIGGSAYIHSIALSVGTPVIAMEAGTKLSTPPQELQEIRTNLIKANKVAKNLDRERNKHIPEYIPRGLERNPMFQLALREDIPWIASLNSLSGFYTRLGLHHILVAKNISEYVNIANLIAENRETAYFVKIRLIEAIDAKYFPAASESRQGFTCGSCTDDLRRFLITFGGPLASNRVAAMSEETATKSDVQKDTATKKAPSNNVGGIVGDIRSQGTGSRKRPRNRKKNSSQQNTKLEEMFASDLSQSIIHTL